jgi:hypothetical protein
MRSEDAGRQHCLCMRFLWCCLSLSVPQLASSSHFTSAYTSTNSSCFAAWSRARTSTKGRLFALLYCVSVSGAAVVVVRHLPGVCRLVCNVCSCRQGCELWHPACFFCVFKCMACLPLADHQLQCTQCGWWGGAGCISDEQAVASSGSRSNLECCKSCTAGDSHL